MNLSSLLTEIFPTHMCANVWIGDQQITEVLSLEIRQQVGSHNELTLRFYQDQVQQEGAMLFDGAEQLLGQVAEVIIKNKNGAGSGKQLENLFVVTHVAFDHSAMNEGILIVKGHAPTYILDGAPHYESFYHQGLASVARTLCAPLTRFKSKVQAQPTVNDPVSYLCRYGESSWNFLKRLSAATGQWLYFNGRELIFGQAESLESEELVYGQNCYRLSMSMQARTVQSGYFDYEAAADSPLKQAADSDTDVSQSDRGFAFGKSRNLFTEGSYTHPTMLPADAQSLSYIGRAKSNSTAADLYRITGESTLHELRVGLICPLKMVRSGTQHSHTPVRIVSITHTLDATGHYTNSFEAISAQSLTPAGLSYIEPSTHPMPAVVTDNNDPLGQGRVQVGFVGWKQEHSEQHTDWIRLLTPDAGSSGAVQKNRGYVFIPEVGDQVMIDFEHNNPDRPFVQGSIFHGKNGAGGFDQNHLKSITTRSGHVIELNDFNGKEQIMIRDKDSVNTITLVTHENKLTIESKGDLLLDAENIYVNARRDFQLTAGNDIAQTAKKNTTLVSEEGTMAANSKTGMMLESKTEGIHITASKHMELKADTLKQDTVSNAEMQVGGNLGITAQGNAEVKGSLSSIQGKANKLELP